MSIFRAILTGLGLGAATVVFLAYVAPVTVAETTPVKQAGNKLRAEVHSARLAQAAATAISPQSKPTEQLAQAAPNGAPKPEAKAPSGTAPEAAAATQSANEGPGQEVAVHATADGQLPQWLPHDDMDAALQPLLSFKISDEDAAAVKEAMAAAAKEDDGAARLAINKIKDPTAKVFAEWRRLHRTSANFQEVMAFRHAHPLFPEPPQEPGIEKNLFLSDASADDVLKFYSNRMPLTGAGKASFAGALIDSGERERGVDLVKLVWRRYALDPLVEAKFLSRFGSLLKGEDQATHQMMLAARAAQKDDAASRVASLAKEKGLRAAVRLRAKRAKGNALHKARGSTGLKRRREANATVPDQEANHDAKAAQFGIKPLSKLVRFRRSHRSTRRPESRRGQAAHLPNEKAKAEAKSSKPAEKSLQAKAAEGAFKLTKERSGGPATLLARAKALRREKADDDLWSLLRSVDPNTADLADPDHWWEFRRSEVRYALNEDRPKTAYAIASAHGPLDGENLADAEFLAGWIALRYLKDPVRAASHFKASASVKGFVRKEARAAYWLGRAKLELGLREQAERLFAEGASNFYTFYGSLARQALRNPACEFRAPPRPSAESIAAFVNEDAFKAVIIAKQLDLQPILINFVLDLARQIRDPQQMTMLMELAQRTVPVHVAVHVGKIALLRGFEADIYAFPPLLPAYTSAGNNAKLEPALLNALTRQESEFHTGSVSRAGARGLMQLMPQTARHVAAANKMKYEIGRLISDPSYNVTLGSAFLAQLVSGYDGSYVLSLAAYNAGPGRVTQWINEFGDPRDKSVDPIDWVERIPFTETREYIQRILESTQLYRCRFEDKRARFRIVEDLHRGRPSKLPDFMGIAGSADLDDTP
ncbi:MAG: lytic transglycosylase domain-containing protein [Rhodomicrobium sp.]